jgi:hypothetical protein
MTPSEDERLYLLVGQAWELRHCGYFTDACQAIVDWQERRRLARLELTEDTWARIVRLYREARAIVNEGCP